MAIPDLFSLQKKDLFAIPPPLFFEIDLAHLLRKTFLVAALGITSRCFHLLYAWLVNSNTKWDFNIFTFE